jgi:hypothetical protein
MWTTPFFDLMGFMCNCIEENIEWRVSLRHIMPLDPMMSMMSFKNISSMSGGNGMANNSAYFSCMFVHLLENLL